MPDDVIAELLAKEALESKSDKISNVRTAQNISITLSPEMLTRAKKLARRENRTLNELMRDAFKEYERNRQWDAINAYGRAKAAELGIVEKDVPRIVKEWRREHALRK